jgi:hypothetical protein
MLKERPMNEIAPDTYIVSIPGTEQTEELSRGAVLERMARGEITPEHWVWSASAGDWKQVSDIPSLQSALPPKPIFSTPPTGVPPGGTGAPVAKKSLLGKLGLQKKAAAPPVAPVITAPAPVKKKVVRKSDPRDEEARFPMISFVVGILLTVAFAVVAVNYEYIDKPVEGSLAGTPFFLVPVYAHLNNFVLPDTLVINALPNPELNRENFAEFLFDLAKSTPPPPFGLKPYTRVDLTPSWAPQYAFRGEDWRQLGTMKAASTDDRKTFILDHLITPRGFALLEKNDSDPTASESARSRLWVQVEGDFEGGEMSTDSTSSSSPGNPAAPGDHPALAAGSGGSAATGAVGAGFTTDPTQALVLIKGDVGQGTGFLTKTPDGPVVITNLHVLSGNPNVKITLSTGEQIKTLSLKGASDRDLAMFAIQDDHYSYLKTATDVAATVHIGDKAMIPGNSEGGEVMLNTNGQIKGVGPVRVEFSNPIYHGNSGSPVFDTKTNNVVAVATEAEKTRFQDEVDTTSFSSGNSAITSTMRYFGLRLDTVPHWDPYDMSRLVSEGTFIQNFEDTSRALDAYIHQKNPMNNKEIEAADMAFRHDVTDPDEHRKVDAVQQLVWALKNVADEGMPGIQNPTNFYPFHQGRVKAEIEYREQIKTALQNASSTADSWPF